mgnify:CR=1 FL=1
MIMSSAEKLGVQCIAKEFQPYYVNLFGPIIQPFTDSSILNQVIHAMMREIDILQDEGNPIGSFHQHQGIIRRIAIAALFQQSPQEGFQSFENQTFEIQLFLMNLAIFVLRVLTRGS